MPYLRFPADQAVGTLDWLGSETQAPVLAQGDVMIPDGVEVTLDVSIITSVRRSNRGEIAAGIWIEQEDVSAPGEVSALEGFEQGWVLEGSGEPVDLGFLRELPGNGITSLGLSWSLVPESFAAITQLAPGLRRLYLAQTGLGDDSLRYVARLRRLTYLQTWGNNFTDDGVQQLAVLTELEHLYLEEETLSAAAFDFVRHLPKLARLGLQDVPLTDGELAELRNQFPRVDVD